MVRFLAVTLDVRPQTSEPPRELLVVEQLAPVKMVEPAAFRFDVLEPDSAAVSRGHPR